MVRVASYSDSSQGEGALAKLEEDFRLLEVQMNAGDREAVRLAFRLMPHAGADDGETLEIMVGRLVRIDPTLFLESVRAQGPKAVREAGGNYGPEYVDRFEARRYETSRRIAALKSVTRAELKAVRDRCIAVLKADLAQESGLR